MRSLTVFNQVSLDGFIADVKGDMSWAHKDDPEWSAFTTGNASGEAELVFGRITHDLMASYWPTPMAMESMPAVAESMNRMPKVVFSRTMKKAAWNNTRLVKSDPAAEMRRMKREPGPGMVIFGSGSIVAQMASQGLIDEYQIIVNPIVLGEGKSMFDGIKDRFALKLIKTRTFGNGNVLLCYQPIA